MNDNITKKERNLNVMKPLNAPLPLAEQIFFADRNPCYVKMKLHNSTSIAIYTIAEIAFSKWSDFTDQQFKVDTVFFDFQLVKQ